MYDLSLIGSDWLADRVDRLTHQIVHVRPSDYNEKHRYLPASVTKTPGYLRYANSPWLREIIDCFDVESPVREVNLMKGVQIGYSTLLESILLYYMGYVKTVPCMYVTADKELATGRLEANIIPMIQQSDMYDIIRSSDEKSTNKKGLTEKRIEWVGGGFCVPFGAQNPNKMRQWSILLMMKDEIDGWPLLVGKDGDPDLLTDDRCAGYWDVRKIFRGSTPLIKQTSFIWRNYQRGDQRRGQVCCLKCGFPQFLEWEGINRETGAVYGFDWETENDSLILESVHYKCANCGHKHFNFDKEKLFSPEYGAVWVPTARPEDPTIRSYHLPAFYSSQPWDKHVTTFRKAYDRREKRVKSVGAWQVFHNNVLALPFEHSGDRVTENHVSMHRRTEYRFGQIPNAFAMKHCNSKIELILCTVDVQKDNLAVAVFGFTEELRVFLIDYWRFVDDDCTRIESPVWKQLRDLIENKHYFDADGREYWIALTLIDAGFANDTIVSFCADYASNVYPILGRDRPEKSQRIVEFTKFETQIGTTGYKIVVDHYKDRSAPVLRRDWEPLMDHLQPAYHFNAPTDVTSKQLKELTVESRREKVNETTGAITYYWHRPKGVDNELWDLLMYAFAGVDILAWGICIEFYELKEVVWSMFWEYLRQNKMFYRDPEKKDG